MKFIKKVTYLFIGDENVSKSDQVWFYGFGTILITFLLFVIGNIVFIGGMK